MNTMLSRSRLAFLTVSLLLFWLSANTQARSLPDFVDLAKKNSPSVVNISTKQRKSVSNRFRHDFRIPDLPEDSPLNEFFERFFGQEGGQGDAPREYDTQSLGSGFVISSDGYILTNTHVVEDADEVIVRLSDRREFVAQTVGKDKRSDVALLKIEASELPVVKIGSTKELAVGEWVLAIGSPFGFDHSVTAGIVSAKGRNLPNENYVPFIQTDVAINPGNSGGPLFNLDGEVVGVNSQIFSRTGGYMGLSFAIPIEMAMNVVDQLRTKGRVTRGWLGVLIQDVTRELADAFGMRHPKGALVARVLPGSPASKSGLQVGDVILKYNDEVISNSSMLPPIVGASRVDRPATLTVLRKGKEISVSVDIGELPAEEALAEAEMPDQSSEDYLGLVVSEMTEEKQKALGLDSAEGVLVEEVNPGPAEVAGLKQGDLIQMIGQEPIRNLADFRDQMESLPAGETVAVLVLRRSGQIFLAMRIPAS
ncbi:MAG: DegQ family serine endoprotease [Gammaproteobacteria bacterium]|nr:DegQ family serine endoprotease [Gammaproteobacteria bacterium]